MGLITGLLGLPTAPMRSTVRMAERVLQRAEREYYDPARITAALAEVDRMREAGELTDEEAVAREDELVQLLLDGQGRGEH